MALNTNFAETATLDNGALAVTGRTEGVEPEWKLITRFVMLSQGAFTFRRAATKDAAWNATSQVEAGTFHAGSAVATGIETYYCENEDSNPPSFITVTWSQAIEIEE